MVRSRAGLAEHKRPFAHNRDFIADPFSVIDSIRPTGIIGVSGHLGIFTAPILKRMAEINERPLIFALSNPTSKAECTAQDAFGLTSGQAASESPFDPVFIEGKKFTPNQGNNAYIFPGVGLGIVASESRRVTSGMFLAAARALADEVSEADLADGRIYPPLSRIREVSLSIAMATAKVAYDQGLAEPPEPDDLRSYITAHMFDPAYRSYV